MLRVAATAGPAPALRIKTPLPLYLPDGIALALGDAPPWIAPWRTCGASGLRGDPRPRPAAPRRRCAAHRAGSVTLTLVDGVKVRLAFSLRGISAALDARGG